MLDLVAKKLFLTKGVGVADDKLTSFEFALRNAGISGTNIVLISSIFPPHAKLTPRKEGLKLIKPGQILFTIYSRTQTNEPHRLISASVGVAQPKDRSKYGYLSEYDAYGQSESKAGDYAEDVAAQCWHHRWELNLISIKVGMKNVNNGPFLAKSIRQKISHSLQRVIKMENGQQCLPQQF